MMKLFPSSGNTASSVISKVKFQKLFGTVLNAAITVWNTLWRRVAGFADTLDCTLGEGMGFLKIEKRLLRQGQDLFREKLRSFSAISGLAQIRTELPENRSYTVKINRPVL